MVRLPVAHCELNHIEMVWSQVKGYVRENNKKYRVNNNANARLNSGACKEVKELVYKGFEEIMPDRWQSLIRHVQEKVN